MFSKSALPWFSDFNCEVERTCGKLPCSQAIGQPWTEFWPPKSGSQLHLYLQSKFPEVFSWRFDRTKPYDRPWRNWTSSALAKREPAVEILSSYSDSGSNLNDLSYCPDLRLMTDVETGNDSQHTSALDLDQQISWLGLPSVRPADFHYIAQLSRYKHEKPYLSRLPCIDGLKRTNIVAKKQSVQIFEVNGHEESFNIDESGFEFAKWPVIPQDWSSSRVRSYYTQELCNWLKNYLGCEEVFPYAYKVRLFL